MDAKASSWHTAFFSPRTSPALAPAQPKPDARSPPGRAPGTRSEPEHNPKPASGIGAPVPGSLWEHPRCTQGHLVPIPARSGNLPPPDSAPSSPQSALISPALPSPAAEELSEGYDGDGRDGDGETEDGGEEEAEEEEDGEEEDVSGKARVPLQGGDWRAGMTGAHQGEAERGGTGKGAAQGAEGSSCRGG